MDTGVISVSVSNHYKQAGYNSEVVTQGILGEQVEILEVQDRFTHIRQQDGYVSWMSSDQVCSGTYENDKGVTVTSHFIRFLNNPTIDAEAVLDGVIGTRLRLIDENDFWYLLELPCGKQGWAEKKYFGEFPAFSVGNVLKQAKEFLGYQYFWGGRSPKGFDCSGFVQTVFGLHGVKLPRDAWQQQEEKLISTRLSKVEAGDLLFFAKTPERVTHVGIALGDSRFIHASGWVKINSLKKGADDFSPEHFETFVSHNRWR